jgi:hypothetical protein
VRYNACNSILNSDNLVLSRAKLSHFCLTRLLAFFSIKVFLPAVKSIHENFRFMCFQKCKMRTVVELKAGLSSGDSQENIRALLEIRYRIY